MYLFTLFVLLHNSQNVVFAQHSYPNHEALKPIRNRVINKLLKSKVDDDHTSLVFDQLNDDGSWPGIDYEDVSRTGFEHSRHLFNMLVMGRSFRQKNSSYYQNEALKSAILNALNFWLTYDFICENWWWNQIGTPRALTDLALLMDENLEDSLKVKMAPIIGRAHLNAWGARPGGDRIKIAGILGKAALYYRDSAILRKVIRTMNEEIHFAYERATPDDKRGLQTDYSFHHRKDRVTSTLSYGKSYASSFADWARLVSGTEYAFSEQSLKTLVDFFLDGICKTSIYATYPDPGAKNRSVSRSGTLSAYSTTMPKQLLAATNYRKKELEKVIAVREGRSDPDYSFNSFFWHTEYMSHQRPQYFTSVRMFSERNHSMEVPYNGEGLMNHHLGEGANFISRTGQEYYNIFPVWDWQKVPGTTVVQKPDLPGEHMIQQKGLTSLVGGVTNQQYGAAMFDFISPLDTLSARKSWFFFDHLFVCLGAAIRSSRPYPVATTLNQSLLKGDVAYGTGLHENTIGTGQHAVDNVKWVLHDSVAYVFPQPQTIYLHNEPKQGSWKQINRQHDSPDQSLSLDVFKLWIEHGTAPQDASYEYFVVPSTEKNAIKQMIKQRPISVLSNTENLQAVYHKKLKMSQLSFYQASEVSLKSLGILKMEQPGLIMLWQKNDGIEISVSDPSRSYAQLNLLLDGEYISSSDLVNISYQKGKTFIQVKMPKDEYAGQSVQFIIHEKMP